MEEAAWQRTGSSRERGGGGGEAVGRLGCNLSSASSSELPKDAFENEGRGGVEVQVSGDAGGCAGSEQQPVKGGWGAELRLVDGGAGEGGIAACCCMTAPRLPNLQWRGHLCR